MFKLAAVICFFVFAIFSNANEVKLVDGKIQAHTEVFGDSTINPETTKINAILKKDENLESLKGKFSIEAISLISDNKDRDTHMYEVLKSETSPLITFEITSISKNEKGYEVNGILQMNNVRKPLSSVATIAKKDENILLNGDFSIKLTDFGLEPPTMFFLTVRDQIDIKYHFNLKEEI